MVLLIISWKKVSMKIVKNVKLKSLEIGQEIFFFLAKKDKTHETFFVKAKISTHFSKK